MYEPLYFVFLPFFLVLCFDFSLDLDLDLDLGLELEGFSSAIISKFRLGIAHQLNAPIDLRCLISSLEYSG